MKEGQIFKDMSKMFPRFLETAIEAIENNTMHRHLLISKKGYLGLGPIPTQKDDMICVLFGCSVPVLIRKVEDHHVLVGECYVHGIMNGEAVDMWKKGELVQQEFHIH